MPINNKNTIDEPLIGNTNMNIIIYPIVLFAFLFVGYIYIFDVFEILQVFVSSAVTYCDQASWQSRIAAKPIQGVFGFLLGGLIWFAIPSTMATTTGLAYLALSTENNTHMLTHNQIDEGWFNC